MNVGVQLLWNGENTLYVDVQPSLQGHIQVVYSIKIKQKKLLNLYQGFRNKDKEISIIHLDWSGYIEEVIVDSKK